MARRTKADAEKTRELIMAAAESLFYEKGVSSTSLNDIAARAGLTRGAIYWHFRNKAVLFDAIHRHVTLPLADMQAAVCGQADPILSLRDFWALAIRDLLSSERKRRIVQILFRKCEYVEEMEGASGRLDAWCQQTITLMKEAFAQALSKNLLADGLSPELAAASAFSFITGIIYYWTSLPDTEQLCQQAEGAITVFFNALHRPAAAPRQA